MSLNISDIISEYGAFYIDSGQNKKRILTRLTQGREITSFATPIKTDDTIFRLANSTFQSLVQPFQKTFTQKGALEIKPNEIRQYRYKIDDEFQPDDLHSTWLGFLAKGGLDRKAWPFVQWLMETHYIPTIDQDMELNEYYKGIYAAPAVGVAGLNGTGMDGLKHQLQAGVDAGTINSVNIGTLDENTIFDQVEKFTDEIAEVYQGVKMNVFMSRKWYKKYLHDKRAQLFYQRTSDAQIDGGIDFTPLDVKPLACMVGTNDIFCTPTPNFLHVSPASLSKNQFKLEESKRSVAVMADWQEGLGFGINEIVWTNIQHT